MKYELKLNKHQLSVIATALEFYSRFLAGQWDIPKKMQDKEYNLQEKYSGFWNKRNYVVEQLKILKSHFTGLNINASYGIGTTNLHENANTAYDIYRPILELFVEEHTKKHSGVNHSVYASPGLSYSKDGRIKIKKVNN